MKVAIATDNYKNVTGHVGRCKGFLIVTVENGEVIGTEERANVFTNHGRGGGNGHHHGHGRGARRHQRHGRKRRKPRHFGPHNYARQRPG